MLARYVLFMDVVWSHSHVKIDVKTTGRFIPAEPPGLFLP